MSEKYNGCTNYETWCVRMWIDNDQYSYHYWRDAARAAVDSASAVGVVTRRERAAINLAVQIRNEIEHGNPLEGSGLYCDLLGAALGAVEWHEVARQMVDDVVESEEGQP